ncbi:Xaa-Pro aminopeptidase [Marinobacterium arenosum]|uniref:Xaa-Pro aminopeptidase n=1 Tax=Marinobacterium arenosum TaxID=2862496 RepID=UPI001C96C6E5|nr:Xaa-Pro aminopeptidase [Marinobacterium arenosum]MBY4676899.1 Xaa-Pro aminopeptidase [Marinobacterium arenosum]
MSQRIEAEVFAGRRARLLAQLPAGSALLLSSAQLQTRNHDVEYPFRQDSNFYYLTGFDEPDALLLLLPGREGGEYVLFCQDRDPEMEIWHGYRTGPEGCRSRYGADDAWPIDQVDEQMPLLLDGRSRLYYRLGHDQDLDNRVHDWLNAMRLQARQGIRPPSELVLVDPQLNEMRLFKAPEEQAVMRKAGELSAEAHVKAMQACRPGVFEYQLEAVISHHFAMHGCRQSAYPSIVGGGANGCVLHYTNNDQPLNDGDLVLIDAGIELDYYAADITRTFPVNGRFSDEQKALYELVLKAQQACIELCRPGVLWDRVHERSVEVLTDGLIELGILTGERDELIDSGAYRDFYMHRIGHWLGLDVHDVGDYKVDGEWRPLQPGMVMTVEPGLYIAPDNTRVDARWRGIGIRIEDNVLITDDGCELLTDGVPKTVAEIEALMAQAQQ